MCALCSTFNPSTFQELNVKYLLPKAFFERNFLILKHLYVRKHSLILITCAVSVLYFAWISEVGHALVSSVLQ